MEQNLYSKVSADDAIRILNRLTTDVIIKTEYVNGRSATGLTKKEEAIRLVKQSSSLRYNDDEHVPNIDVCVARNNLKQNVRYVKLMFPR